MNKETLDKINKFTRRDFSEDELYTFSVILCDNDTDRDFERFSDNALSSLSKLFIGKTGIFDHDPSTNNQNARIFETEIVSDPDKLTRSGSPYKFLKAYAYMVRTDNNKNLIAEIDGGIKKEVSISCAASKRICSVCGCDRSVSACSHVKGKKYNGTLCFNTLDDITDAYEWSFVAVPAQVNAGVTKKYTSDGSKLSDPSEDYDSACFELRKEIRRLAFLTGGRAAAIAAFVSAKNMDISRLNETKNAYERLARKNFIPVQLAPPADNSEQEIEQNSVFILR